MKEHLMNFSNKKKERAKQDHEIASLVLEVDDIVHTSEEEDNEENEMQKEKGKGIAIGDSTSIGKTRKMSTNTASVKKKLFSQSK